MSRAVAGSLVLLALGACGGGSSGGGPKVTTGDNVTPLVVDAGPAGTVNLPFATVTICVPGTTSCQTVDHVLVDTGSTGLRIIYEALGTSPIVLPHPQTAAGDPLDECIQFADGYSWGSVRSADVKIANGIASNIPIHLIGDPSVPAVPVDCPNGSPSENSVVAFGANGVLGVDVFRADCPACVTTALAAAYYGCPTGGNCVNSMLPLAQQVQNPIAHFAVDNNGVALELPSIGSAGQQSARGSLILGIDTQSNNQLGTAEVLTVGIYGEFTTTYKGSALNFSFIDSGSNGNFFADPSLPVCTINVDFYCPDRMTLSAMNTGKNGATSTVSFDVANADTLHKNNANFSALPNVAGPNTLASSFDWGLPFFYGRRVYFAIEGQATSAGAGPFVAY